MCWLFVHESEHLMGEYIVEKDRSRRCRPPPIISEFCNYCVMMGHCTGYAPHSLCVVCRPWRISWPIVWEYLESHLHTCVYSRVDQIYIEIVQNQIITFLIILWNRIPSYIFCHTNHVVWCEIFAELQESMVTFTGQSDTFIIFLNDIRQTVKRQDRRPMSYR